MHEMSVNAAPVDVCHCTHVSSSIVAAPLHVAVPVPVIVEAEVSAVAAAVIVHVTPLEPDPPPSGDGGLPPPSSPPHPATQTPTRMNTRLLFMPVRRGCPRSRAMVGPEQSIGGPRCPRMIRVLVLLALSSSTAQADAPVRARNAAQWCGTDPGESFVVNADGTWTPSWGAKDPKPPRYSVVWRGYLDGDKRRDVILDEGGCGFHECWHTAYVQCRDKTYARVMEGAYASHVRVRRRARGWAVLELEHVGELENGRRPHSWSPVRFGADGYVEE
jgi:hypothetical protein